MAFSNLGNSHLGPWFVKPPVVGGPDINTVVKATSNAQAQQYAGWGYTGWATQAEAQAAANEANGSIALSTNPAKAVVQAGTGNATQSGQNKTTSQDIIGSFNVSSWFVRVGEILLGLMLIGVGLARVTGTANFISDVLKTKMPIPIPI